MDVPHTPFTYHRTWETGLGVEIRVATVSPAFFCLSLSDADPPAVTRIVFTPTDLKARAWVRARYGHVVYPVSQRI